MAYDDKNIFARILRGEIAAKKIYEDDFALAFHDIRPQAPQHALVIPKGPYATHDAFSSKASDAEIAGFERAVGKVARMIGVDRTGYRLISNCGDHAHQEVPHYHVHILGGRPLGPLLSEM